MNKPNQEAEGDADGQRQGQAPAPGQQAAPQQSKQPQPLQGATDRAVTPSGITVYRQQDGSIVDEAGNQYDEDGNPLRS